MSPTPEQEARQRIDAALGAAGWLMQDRADVNLAAGATTIALPWPASRPIPSPASAHPEASRRSRSPETTTAPVARAQRRNLSSSASLVMAPSMLGSGMSAA